MSDVIGLGQIAGAAGNVWSGYMQADAAKYGADAKMRAAWAARQDQRKMYDQNRADLAAYRNAGESAVGSLSDLANNPFSFNFSQDDPSYKFRMSQGLDAVNSSAAARGGFFSGGTGKALADYGQGLASTEYGNAYNRALATRQNQYGELSNIATLGENAAAQTGAAGMNAANSMGNYLTGAGAAQAAGAQGQANALSDVLRYFNNSMMGAQGAGNMSQYNANVPNYSVQNRQLIDNMQLQW